MIVDLARKLPFLEWGEICRLDIFKAECERCVNLLFLGCQNIDEYNCFPKALVAQTRASPSIGPVATKVPNQSATEGLPNKGPAH